MLSFVKPLILKAYSHRLSDATKETLETLVKLQTSLRDGRPLLLRFNFLLLFQHFCLFHLFLSLYLLVITTCWAGRYLFENSFRLPLSEYFGFTLFLLLFNMYRRSRSILLVLGNHIMLAFVAILNGRS